MIKKVLKDYRDGFRWSKFKESYNFNMLWFYIYFLTVFPMIMHLNETTEQLIDYYAMAIPLIFGMYSLSAIPIRLPKQMFLCPMSEDERRKYVELLFLVRLLGPVCVGIVTQGLVVIYGIKDILMFGVMIFAIFSLMVCGSITSWPGSTWETNYSGKKRIVNKRLKGLYGFSVTGMLTAIFCMVFLPVAWDGEPDIWFWGLVLCGGVLMIVCNFLVLRYFRPVMDIAIDFESYYQENEKPKKA